VSAQPAERAPAGRSRRAREPAPRQVVQKVKLTERERDQLRARAGELGVSVPRLLVESALADVTVTGTERRAETAELFETRRLLATVANNVNQLARLANTSGKVPVGQRLEDAVGDVEEIVGRLRALTGARR
jgi:hypothetical protein